MEWLQSEWIWKVLALAGGGLWTFFRGTEFWGEILEDRERRALDGIVGAVMRVYREYVSELKHRNGGKLTDAQKAEARALAKGLAVDGADRGARKSVALTDDGVLEFHLERAISDAKGA